jgi:hypothetical protein
MNRYRLMDRIYDVAGWPIIIADAAAIYFKVLAPAWAISIGVVAFFFIVYLLPSRRKAGRGMLQAGQCLQCEGPIREYPGEHCATPADRVNSASPARGRASIRTMNDVRFWQRCAYLERTR